MLRSEGIGLTAAIITGLGLITPLMMAMSAARPQQPTPQERAEQDRFTDLILTDPEKPDEYIWPDAAQIRTHVQTIQAPDRAQPTLNWIASRAVVCEGPAPQVTLINDTTRYLDRAFPGWRAEEQRVLNQALSPFTAAARTLREQAQQVLRDTEQRRAGHPEDARARAEIVESVLRDIPQCAGRPWDAERARLYLSGLRQGRLNQPGRTFNLSTRPRADGLSDAQALCLSGSYDLRFPAFLAGEFAQGPTGGETHLRAEHPGLLALPDRLITPADLKAAGCTLEEQTELFSRVVNS